MGETLNIVFALVVLAAIVLAMIRKAERRYYPCGYIVAGDVDYPFKTPANKSFSWEIFDPEAQEILLVSAEKTIRRRKLALGSKVYVVSSDTTYLVTAKGVFPYVGSARPIARRFLTYVRGHSGTPDDFLEFKSMRIECADHRPIEDALAFYHKV